MKKDGKLSALVVDDNPITFMILEEMLDVVGFRIDYAEDGRTGIRHIQRTKYDIVFLDYKMPGINGETVQKIARRTSRDIPIVMISGNLTKDRVIRLKMNGVKGFIAKPFEPETLYKLLNKIFCRDFEPTYSA